MTVEDHPLFLPPTGPATPIRRRPSYGLHRREHAVVAPRPQQLDHNDLTQPLTVVGKQFIAGDRAHLMRGVTYGTFRPRADGERFPETDVAVRDFAAIAAAGFNTIRTYTAPPEDIIAAAAAHGLRTFAGIHTTDWRYLVGLSRRAQRRQDEESVATIRETLRRLRGRPEISAVCVGNEIPADVVRWFGSSRVAGSITRLVDAARDEDPNRLVTYANYPSAEYMSLPALDFVTFNVFLESPIALREYLSHLHHTTNDRPLVLGELGRHVDGTAESEHAQARLLDEQHEVALERGVAGTFVFAWTDEWHVGEAEIEDWSFGLTRRDRSMRPSLETARRSNKRTVADLRRKWPRVSVVICARNEEATIGECLTHATALDYPDFEVIVIDDGSTDRTSEIARTFADVRLVTVAHGGLGNARNVGISVATGEIIAYLDADAYPTTQWLRYLYLAFDRPDVGGAGGPNLSPPSDPIACQRVAQAPGGPAHVLLSADRAEHVPGCNMAFWRSVLIEIGGFDPVYRSAGDDVDVCWKVLDRGWKIGFHPSAVVWHHRRGSVRTYLKQQRGYGRAEALVAARHPDRFGGLRTAKWRGRIYSPERRNHPGQRIYRGSMGTAAYQSVYHRDSLAIDWIHQVGIPVALVSLLASLPLAFEWMQMRWVAVACVAALVAIFGYDTARAGTPALTKPTFGTRLAIAALHLTQPVARWWGRARHWQVAHRDLPGERATPSIEPAAGGAMVMATAQPRDEVARSTLSTLRSAGYAVQGTSGWEDYDGRLGGSLLVAGDLITSDHPAGIVQARVRTRLRRWRLTLAITLVAFAFLALPRLAPLVMLCLVALDIGVGCWRLSRRTLKRVLARRRGAEPTDKRKRSALRAAFRLFPRALRYVKPYRALAAAAIVLTVLSAIVNLAHPWPLAFVVDTAIDRRRPPGWASAILGSGTANLILLAAIGSVAIMAIGGLIGIASEYVTHKIDLRMALDLRTDMLEHSHRLSMAFHDSASTGNVMFRINTQAEAVGRIVVAIPDLAQSLLTLIGMLFIALRIDAQLALLSIGIVPFVIWATGRYANRIEPELRRVQEMESTNLRLVHEGLMMLRVIVAFGREGFEHDKFRAQGDETVDARVRLTVRQALFNLTVTSVTAAGTAAVIGFGAHGVVSGRISAGNLLVIIAYVAAAYAPLEALTNSVTVLQQEFVALEQALELLDTPVSVVDPPGGIPLERVRGDISFRNVDFSYASRLNTITDVSFDVRAGEVVAIVGATGAGKTTLVNLIPRMYDADRGAITIDGVHVRDISLASLRAQFSVVLQEPLLFSDTIRENIAYSRPEASAEEIEQAARDANAHDFIMRLPNKYETRLGERGTKISGGERQRISVARAFLRDAPILILDEPTSSIDSRTEAVILDALDRLMEGRTTILIAHRLSTIRRADRVLVMHEGRLVQNGTHDELVNVDGIYRELWTAQALQRERIGAARTAIATVKPGKSFDPPTGAPQHLGGATT